MRRVYKEALSIANSFIDKFIHNEYTIVGSIRRKEEKIGDVDIIVFEPLAVIEKRFESSNLVKKVNGGTKKMDVNYKGMRFNLYFALPFYHGAMLFFLTGPAGYSIAYRLKAKKKGWHLDQYGLKDEKGAVIASRTEAAIYKAFGKSYKEPELRGK